ncbi:type II methionyl aminopeptidase [Nitrososphaera sp.]|uniref:type II methionyl aminopeptidase n=1 Tax=Nitrososphaera sp. TaxID=1971748 RepID=UPI0017BC5726|nr:type II methionyl aminopeptidase [Nitrososphaera sp.]NWG36853.1 type II methionyl aminopeptidase [Nitrososphaera sp.]
MNVEAYLKAGKIASKVREDARKKYHVGSTLLQVCEDAEAQIREMGAEPAFPVNASLNEIAAHYTAEPNDETPVKEGDVLKIDIGVHVEGYIADTAVTVCYDPKYDQMVKAAEAALAEAVRMAKVGTKASDIGRAIENIISRMGYRPIQNLSGHSLQQYTIHAGKSIPNIWTLGSSFTLQAGEAYAIEPFATTRDGAGVVHEGKVKNIFGITSRKPTKDDDADELLNTIWSRYKSLPFALRWLTDAYDVPRLRRLTDVLIKKKNVHAYPILVEGREKIVVQAEHTLIPADGGSTVITL